MLADKHHITPDLTWQFSVYAFSVKIPNESRYAAVTENYIIFSVGIISIEESEPHYLDFFALDSRNVEERRKAIDVLENISIYSNTIDVVPEDQLLILVTCVKKDEERSVVAARRIRDGESQKELKALAEKSR